jgi:hypothetical protein
MDFIYVLLIGPAVLGLLTRSWLVVVVPLIAVPIYAIGKDERWWGCCGTGDAWQVAAIALTVVGVVGTALAVVLGRLLSDRLTGRGGQET